MTTILKLVTLKRLIGCFFAFGCIFWLFNGKEIISRPPENAESLVISEFKSDHPKATDWIESAQAKFGEFNMAVAIQSSSGPFLNPAALQKAVEIRARLTSLYVDDQANDPSVLWSHGMAIDAMRNMESEPSRYLDQLEAARKDKDYWSLVRNDPIALTSTLLQTEPDLRREYQENQDWYTAMVEVLIAMIGVPESDESVASTELVQLDDLLKVASEGNPYLKQLVPDPQAMPIEACIYYETFRQFGKAISLAADEGVPVKEAVEVIVLNRDALLSEEEESNGAPVGNPTEIASRLIELRQSRPSVWVAAQRDGYVLSFDRLTPSLAQTVLEKHADLGVASLIVTQYPDTARQATKIVDRYGELGVAVLAQYEGSERFRQLLQSEDVDHRIAMVAVLKSDEGLESVVTNPKYIDTWIGEDGDPLQDQWWVNVPLVGGIGKVAVNYAQGVPSSWGEIGWAAWDVADVGLMVVSLGTSKIATEGAKQAAKQTAKRTGRSAAQKLTKAGVRRASVTTGPSALSRMVSVFKTSKAAAPIRWSSRTVIYLTHTRKNLGGKLITTSNKIIQTSKRIPPNVRTWAARGLLGASLYVRGPERIRALAASLNKTLKEAAKEAFNAIPQAITDAITAVKSAAADAARGNMEGLTNMAIIGVLGAIAIALLFDIGPHLNFAGGGTAGGKKKSSNKRSKRKS